MAATLCSQTKENESEQKAPFKWLLDKEEDAQLQNLLTPIFPKENHFDLESLNDNTIEFSWEGMPVFPVETLDDNLAIEIPKELPKQYLKIFIPKKYN